MLIVRPYVPDDAPAWDTLVVQSRTGNLLHRRSYMDYHAHRFVDTSLIIERDGKIVAAFPANRDNDTVVSHGGLTYAGLLFTDDLRAELTLAVFEKIANHYREIGVKHVIYKAVPHVFHRYPAEEDLYALHRHGARLMRRDVSSVIGLQDPSSYSRGRKSSINKARRSDISLNTATDIRPFHTLLSEVLRRHDAAPTHSVAELHMLQERFPREIVLHEARHGDELLAGVLIYDFGRAVHTQYMAVSEQGRRCGALDMLLDSLISDTYASRSYFSFGISTEQVGKVLNGGLIAQKERFGARAIVHDTYEWSLT
jgi:hypothetical protein